MFKFKHTLSTIVALALSLSIGSALAAVDVNTANSDALRGIKGIGPAKAKAILDERQAHGPFKDAADLGARVKGMGGKTVACLEAEGLTIGASAKTAANIAGNPATASPTQVSTSSAQKPAVVKK